jgi:hypothetical protein
LREVRLCKSFYLIIVWMTVAPIPVVSLHPVVLSLVLAIAPVLFTQILPVSMVFAVVPVVVVTVVPIVNSDLHVRFLWPWASDHYDRGGKGRSQE